MYVRFLKDVPSLDSVEYKDLFANRDSDSTNVLLDIGVYWTLKQGSHRLSSGLFGYELDDVVKRAGLDFLEIEQSFRSLVARGFIEVVDDTLDMLDSRKAPMPQDVVGAWNDRVAQNNRRVGSPRLCSVSILTNDRKKKIRVRLKEKNWWPTYRKILQLVPIEHRSGFSWQPDLEWLVKNGTNVFRLAEGQYQAR